MPNTETTKRPAYPITRTHIRESNLLEGYDSSLMDDDGMAAWRWLTKKTNSGEPMTHQTIQELQRRLTLHSPATDEWAGAYRDRSHIEATVWDRPATAYRLINEEMTNWIQDMFLFSPREMHVRFMYIYPFIEGNELTGRMLMWWLEREQGINPTILWHQHKQDYLKWFERKGNE